MEGDELFLALIAVLLCGRFSATFFIEAQQFPFPMGDGRLQMGFYASSCPQAEMIVRDEVNMALRNDLGFAAGLVRLHFHDCFVRGCDGSVLIDSTPVNTAEKDSPVNNPSLRGFQVIDRAKARLEAACMGVVSCADILAFAARDSIAMTGGLPYPVPAGRRDGRVSIFSETFSNLPGPNFNLSQLTISFVKKGFSQDEMVTLSGIKRAYDKAIDEMNPKINIYFAGAHTIGQAHCTTLSSRLYNFSATAAQDPVLDQSLAMQLKKQCPQGNGDASLVVPMDPRSPNALDASYYANLMLNRGLFASDQALMADPSTANQVMRNAFDNSAWRNKFSQAMIKLGQLQVLTGSDGEIRLNCRVIN